MKKLVKYMFIFSAFLLSFINVNAKEADLYFYYGEGCPHCAKEEVFLKEMEEKYQDLNIHRFETYYNDENNILLEEAKASFNITMVGVPFTVIGDEYLFGYSESYNEKLEKMIVKQISDESDVNNGSDKKEFNIPLIGKIDVKQTSLVLISVVLGLVDGFNPCAMWVLLFLISTLIGMKNKKRRWILGTTFLVTSALVYMLIMLSWLEIVVSVGTTIIVRTIIAVIAILGGIFNLKKYITSKNTGCEIIDDKKRSKIFSKIKTFTKEKSLWLALVGIITLAISVNLVELACSAGIPILFSSVLAVNEVSTINSFLYTLIYIFFFLIDDLIVFMIAMLTLKLTGISTKYTKYSSLVGGILMLIIGLLLIIKPEWIMFNF